jgi:CHAT domain-containing protein
MDLDEADVSRGAGPGVGALARAWAAGVILIVLLGGCTREAPVLVALSERCLPLGGSQQVGLEIPARGTGTLHVTIRERGISASAAIVRAGRALAPAASPIDRLGSIDLSQPVTKGETTAVRITSSEPPDVSGSVCVAAQLLPPSQAVRARAAQWMASASAATYRGEWQNAFGDYLAAARLYDRLGASADAARARHAVAELEYSQLRRERDSAALAASLLQSTAGDALDRGARLTLMAKALLEVPEEKQVKVDATRELLRAAAALFGGDAAGLRELPRLQILDGFLYYRTGQPEEARERFNQAASACQQLRDWECFARARQNLAALAEEGQDYAAALAAYDEALQPLDPALMPKLVADISYNLGRLDSKAGLFSRSEQAHRTAMRLYAQLGYCDAVRRSASSLGEMLLDVGGIVDAATYLDRAITLTCSQLLAAEQGAAPTETAATSILQAAGWPNRRVAELTRGCNRESPLGELTLDGDIAVFQALLALSEIARLEGQLPSAEACLARASVYALDTRMQTRLQNAMGVLALDEHHARAARSAFERAFRIAETGGLTQASDFRGLTQLGLAQTAVLLGENDAARRSAYAALQLSSARADIGQIVTSLRLLASSYSASGQQQLAVATLRTAVRLIEQVPTNGLDAERRATYLATQHAVFAELMDILLADAGSGANASGNAWEAFAVAEQGHARSIRYAIDQAARDQTQTPPAQESSDYRSLLRAIADLARQDKSGSETLVAQIRTLELPPLQPDNQPNRVQLAEQLQQLHAVLLEYAVGRTDVFAFIVDGDAARVVRLGSRDAIARAAGELSEQLRSSEPVPSHIRAAARELAQLVLWPVSSYLLRERIILVPDDALHTVPFAVLPWSRSAGDLLVHHAEISSVPSARLLDRRARERSAADMHFVLLGDPELHRVEWHRDCDTSGPDSGREHAEPPPSFDWTQSLPSLPGSQAEVLAVSALVKQAHPSAAIDTLLKCTATSDALRHDAPGARLLHIATHGLVDARRPRLSALALTPERGGDGAFRLLDILGLQLNARLVVLSACDTSRGRLLPGEGVLGLAQAFLQAGAESVVASYWRVEDAATVSFMQQFYRHMLIEQLPAAAALRRTQLDAAEDSGSYSWAAFNVYGRPDASL